MSVHSEKDINRFWSNVIRNDENQKDCWNYCGYIENSGYGRIQVKGKRILAHRMAFESHHNRNIKEGMILLHSCDNRLCCNPHHLSEGTYQDNSDDMMKKGRNKQVKGEKHHSSKLTQEQVNIIRIKYDIYANTSTRSLAKEFGVSQATINEILNFKIWK